MNNLQTFKNDEFGNLEVVTVDGKYYFPATECAKMLGYSNPQKAVRDHCRDDGCTNRSVIDSMGRPQEKKYISEGNLYRLIAKSKMPSAERFEIWVFDEVLPTIRKTGGYVSNEDLFVETYLSNTDEQTREMFRATLKTVRELNGKIEKDKPKVLFANAVSTAKTTILIGDLAKLLKQNGIDIGAKRLFKWMRNNGYLIKRNGSDYNSPTQRSMEMGLFEVKETTIEHSDGSISVKKTTKVTGKGQQYFINKFLNNSSTRLAV